MTTWFDGMTEVENLPTKVKICDELDKRKKTSPDFAEMRLYNWIPVFFYDDFMRGLQYNRVLMGKDFSALFLGNAKSTSPNYSLKNPHFPVAFHNNIKTSPSRGHVLGEVYALPPELLLEVDNIKSNTIMFKREKRFFVLEDQEYKLSNGKTAKPTLECWIYMGAKWWENQTLNCMPLYKQNNISKFYRYVGIPQTKVPQRDHNRKNDLFDHESEYRVGDDTDYTEWWQERYGRHTMMH